MIDQHYKPGLLLAFVLALTLLQTGCATTPQQPTCPTGTQNLPDCPPLTAVVDETIEHIYKYRTWLSPKELGEDPIAYGMNADRLPRR
jgi:hypothetical protein